MKTSPYPRLLAVSFLLSSLVFAGLPAESSDREFVPSSSTDNTTAPDTQCFLEFATIGGGVTTDKLRVDPSGAENEGNEIARFWQSSNSNLGNNFSGGCPSQHADQIGGGWWRLSQAPLRGLRAILGDTGCDPNSCPVGPLTVLVEEIADNEYESYFIAFQVDPTPSGVRHWDLSRVDPSPSPSVLTMQRFPSMNITGSSRVGSTVTIDILFPDVAPNVHAVSGPGVDTPLPASAIVKSYDLYSHVGSWEPGRHAADWTLVEQFPYEDGPTEGSWDTECDWDTENEFFAVGLTFHGGDGPDIRSALVGTAIHLECATGQIPTVASGVLEYGANPCASDSEALVVTDPCDGHSAWTWSSRVDLEQHVCEMVFLDGIEMFPPGLFDCAAILVYTLEPTGADCLVQVRELIAGSVPEGLHLEWNVLPCSDDYDVIRGALDDLTDGALGTVLCIGNDTALPQALDTTGQDPDPGEGFFYLVRARGTVGTVQYGHSSAGTPRLPELGDCPVD